MPYEKLEPSEMKLHVMGETYGNGQRSAAKLTFVRYEHPDAVPSDCWLVRVETNVGGGSLDEAKEHLATLLNAIIDKLQSP